MAEPFGIVAGSLSIAALFNNCIDCFRLVDFARNFGTDYNSCRLKLDIVSIRLSRWGQLAYVNEDNSLSRIGASHIGNAKAKQVLEQILELFWTAQQLSRRYSSHNPTDDNPSFQTREAEPESTVDPGYSMVVLRNQLHQTLKEREKLVGVKAKMRWAFKDKERFESLLRHVTDLVDGLEKILPMDRESVGLIHLEIEDLNDQVSLNLLSEIATDVDEAMSKVAAQKARALIGTNVVNEAILTDGAKMGVGDEYSDAVAIAVAQHNAKFCSTNNQAGRVNSRGLSRFLVGNRFGGRSIFDD